MTWPAKPWLTAALFVAATAHADPQHPADDPAQPHALSDADLLSQATELALKEETIEIHDDAPAESASSVHLDRDTLGERSRTQMSDLLRNVPGLVVSQHAGGGKADQYFIRGFDADHGTDIAVFSDGVPVNLSSHGHGQGYADTHWMIPETIDALDVYKGPYAARYGDYYTAGALELRTLDKIDRPTMYISGATPLAGPRAFDNYDRRIVAMASPSLRADDKTLLAAQIADNDGPFIHPSGFAQANGLVKWQGLVGPGWLKLEGNLYSAHWHASGQLPESLVDSGRLNRFDSVDSSEGGITSRYSAQASYQIDDSAGGRWHLMSYVVRSKLQLWSNFTLFARDPVNGDEIEQTDGRWLYGLDAGYQRAFKSHGIDTLVTAGAQLRADDVVTSLWHDANRVRLGDCFETGANPCNDNDNHIRDLGAYVEANVIATHWLHLFPGVRLDRLSWDVMSLAPPAVAHGTLAAPMVEGSAARTVASPKLSVEIHETDQVNLFANFGGGFHSNDARAAVSTGGAGGIARAWGGEFGARVKPAPRARLALAAWYLWLSSEQVWNGDEGTTEPSGATQRLGLDMEAALDATPWLSLDANLTFSQSSFVENAGNHNALALAPRWMGSGGATAHGKLGFVAVRARGIGDRPGNEAGTLTAKGYLIVDVIAGKQIGKFGLNLTINNALNADWREAQFADSSRVSPTADVVEQMHFTPGMPLTATLTASYRL
jgi:outer membrane receptor protein involved in Fe transport